MSFWVLRRWKPVTTILQCTFYWLILCTCYYSISIMADLEAGKYSHTFSKFSAVWILIWESNRSLGVPNFTHFQVTPSPTKNSRFAHKCICMHFSLQHLIPAMTGLSKFFGIPLVPGLLQSQVGKSEAMTVKSHFYAFPPKTKPKLSQFWFWEENWICHEM